MVDQAQIDDAPAAAVSPPRAVARNTAELFSDVLTLAELQGRLLLVDLESGLWKIMPLVITLLAGIMLTVSCLPIAMVTIALALVEFGQMSPVAAFAATLLGGAVCSLLLVAAGAWQFKAGVRILERSHQEWKQNVRWIKNVLQRMGRSGGSENRVVDESRW